MKHLIKKYVQTSSTMLILCIAVYATVCAQQVCCSTIVTDCIQASNRYSAVHRTDSACKTSPTHHLISQGISNSWPNKLDAADTCCGTDHCDEYSQTTYTIPSLRYDFYPLQKAVSAFDAGNNGAQTTIEPYYLPPSLNAVPIYILTQSIIC